MTPNRNRSSWLLRTPPQASRTTVGSSGRSKTVVSGFWLYSNNCLFLLILSIGVIYGLLGWYLLYPKPPMNATTISSSLSSSSSSSSCSFRHYPNHRFYKLHASQQPDFLIDTDYIYGQWPMVLKTRHASQKLCVDQSSWQRNITTLPFADGTNPSIISRKRSFWANESSKNGVEWLATICMTNSQCRWNDSPEQIQSFRLNTQEHPDTVQTLLLLLDQDFHTLQQTSIVLKRDAPFGKNKKLLSSSPSDGDHLLALDDARLFVHQGQLWISYREGPLFGYDAQVINPLHVEFHPIFKATIRASETTFFCCGRNMALLEDPDALLAVTWVDPVTVVPVDTTPLIEKNAAADRKLLETKHSLHIHGTNAFMVHWNDFRRQDEYLGVAHFHRPDGRQKNPYARFGHHYTHAFYSLRRKSGQEFILAALSQEFVLPMAATREDDAEVIQFVSGLEWDRRRDQFVLAYGINDCEAAAVRIDANLVHQLLRPVTPGAQVADFMKPFQRQNGP